MSNETITDIARMVLVLGVMGWFAYLAYQFLSYS